MTEADRPDARRANEGPRAAAGNRAALIAAAREIYAERGLDVALSGIARRAGVGQGVLYRHFPNRDALVSAVLEENVRDIEEAAAAEGATLEGLLGVLTWHVAQSDAFTALLRVEWVGEHHTGRAYVEDLGSRVGRALEQHLPPGHRLGTAEDLVLAVAMVSGAAVGPTHEVRERRALAAWRLLGVEVGAVRLFGVRPPHPVG
ncbi:TetR/AcrR family transcriptional regulator [Streptomyces sp. 35G-GA-8]|uniref:TetR/AcrR family transcriptional regulator n=1 Tax=Streptomyces sp. 35G-GA-8 TaxID=2939434 RepID=UPI00201F674F|nr:helix-turn-helix domain-containing protein [Streptomyces sp. 35G-GA-8]MCL7382111.1 TetR/AcrR family transcriptional regulator [Streptomyces sp. 35G-GA-8]